DLSVKERQELLGKLREETIEATKAERENLKAQEETAKTKITGNASILPREKPKMEPRFFSIIRDLTLLGYFTSEIGATQAYEFVEIPGRYDGCVDLKPGQRVWS